MTNQKEIGVQLDSQQYDLLQKLAEERGIGMEAITEELAEQTAKELARRTIPKPCLGGVVGFRRA